MRRGKGEEGVEEEEMEADGGGTHSYTLLCWAVQGSILECSEVDVRSVLNSSPKKLSLSMQCCVFTAML